MTTAESLRALYASHPAIMAAADELDRLHKWIFATAVSFDRSGLTIDEYNAITESVKAAFSSSPRDRSE